MSCNSASPCKKMAKLNERQGEGMQDFSSPILLGTRSSTIEAGNSSDECSSSQLSPLSQSLKLFGTKDYIENLLEEVSVRLLIWQREQRVKAAKIIQTYYRNYKERKKC